MPDTGVTVTLDRTDAIVKQITALTKTSVMVGIPGEMANRNEQATRLAAKRMRKAGPVTEAAFRKAGGGGTINNATIGYISEFGSPARNIPARPWLIPAVNRMKDHATQMLRKAAEFNLDGKPGEAENALNALGLYAQNKVKLNITSGGDPPFAPNAPSTVAQKGSSRPLVNTANFLNSILYVLRKRA